MPAPRALPSTCALVLSMLVAGAAAAAPSAQRMVAVVRTVGAGAEAQEVATRIIAELMASEVAIVAVSCAEFDLACAAPPTKNIVATVLIVGRTRSPTVAVLGAPHAGTRKRIDIRSAAGAAPTALAVRTMEVLRAVLLEPEEATTAATAPVTTTPPPSPSQPSSPATSSAAPTGHPLAAPPPLAPSNISATSSKAVDENDDDDDEPSEHNPFTSTRPSVRFGPAWFGSVSGLVSSFGAAAAFIQPATPRVRFSAFLAGGAFGNDEQTTAGSASISQVLGLVQAELHGTLGRRFGLSSGLGAGFHYLHVQGHAITPSPTSLVPPGSPLTSRTDGRLAVALSGSVAATLAVTRALALFLDGRVFFLTQVPVVLVNGVEVGRTGDPGLSLTAGVEFRP